mmetsp:Transcript_15310/g.18953  ORF Transcript_15310/g.18953 Transcript_15310/m.18953 type:complete len:380 (+) Transcript_15310:276-1415(+)|eukprot:CAMPEP_0204821974 /NCGR_PEP_ID=MMETSP1346-20131115/160_1 /ASSEMBLY_ACC=CAM_ASM_000771 /TAXON_ID=215587 /ORGANISM="Aplanochytrium stocchinoi, Strain GSBS06" /LENGTH=379 /DNA_ID=CAMNT_0051947965 /DNA_START=273 /DNA_END=1412 /DNA_ORIENTATION=-
MGNLCRKGISPEEKEAHMRNYEIQRRIQKEAEKESRKVKLLLLGAGESGKSTIFKQMRINYGGKPLDPDEVRGVIPHIRKNIYDNFLSVLKFAQDDQKIDLGEILGEDKVETFMSALATSPDKPETQTDLTPELASDITTLWHSPAIQDVWKMRGKKYQALDSLEHFLTNIDRIAAPDYFPTTEDYLLNRVRSTGMTNIKLVIQGCEFDIMDVGGQRSERRKWIQCFDNVTAIIFVAAISEYDQTLFEDSETDRIAEAITLFKRVLNYKIFKQHPIILFLNKNDIFQKKLFEVPLRVEGVRNEDFAGPYAKDAGNDPKKREEALVAAQAYMRDKFLSVAEGRQIYDHMTTATDSENVRRIFDACVDIVLTQSIAQHFYR